MCVDGGSHIVLEESLFIKKKCKKKQRNHRSDSSKAVTLNITSIVKRTIVIV